MHASFLENDMKIGKQGIPAMFCTSHVWQIREIWAKLIKRNSLKFDISGTSGYSPDLSVIHGWKLESICITVYLVALTPWAVEVKNGYI